MEAPDMPVDPVSIGVGLKAGQAVYSHLSQREIKRAVEQLASDHDALVEDHVDLINHFNALVEDHNELIDKHNELVESVGELQATPTMLMWLSGAAAVLALVALVLSLL
jgi:hypothetical protein